MRTVGGLPLSENDWQALQATEIANNTSSAEKPDVTGWYHTCYVWSVMSMAAFLEARESARKAQKIFFLRTGRGHAYEFGHTKWSRDPEPLPCFLESEQSDKNKKTTRILPSPRWP